MTDKKTGPIRTKSDGTPLKTMTVREFWESGLLQETNRLFLHQLGVALSVAIDRETDEVTFGPIWDYRDQPEGLAFAKEDIEQEKVRKVNELRKRHIIWR